MDEKQILDQLEEYRFEKLVALMALRTELNKPNNVDFPCNDYIIDKLIKKISNCNWNLDYYNEKLSKLKEGKSEE